MKRVTCAPAPPSSVKRHVVDEKAFAAWRFVRFRDVLALPDATLDPIAAACDLPAAPVLVRADDKSPEVWLAEVLAMPTGAPLRDRPILAQGSGPAVYVLDDPAFDRRPDPGAAPSDPSASAGGGVGGCAIPTGGRSGGPIALVLLVLFALRQKLAR